MVEYRRKLKINERLRIGNGTVLQQYIFRLPLLNNWVQSISIITQSKTFRFGGQSYKSSNAQVHRALEQLVNLGAFDKR